jgi:hypothetical protein
MRAKSSMWATFVGSTKERVGEEMDRFLGKIILALAVTCVLTGGSAAQTLKIGVLPYADATASGQANTGDSLSRLTQAEIVHSTQLEGRVLQIANGLSPQQLDSEKIMALGKEQNVDVVVMGTVLDAHVEESAQTSSPRSIFGQSVSANAHSYKATVTLQADVYQVSTGKKLDSFRMTAVQTDKKVGAGAATTLGNLDTSSTALQTSTLGKGLQKAISDLVKRIDADKSKVALAPKQAAS